MAKDDKAILATAKDRFDACVSAESTNRAFADDDARFYVGSPDNGWQWPGKIKKDREDKGRPCLTINKLPQHVKQITNEQRQNRPAIKVLPVDDKADPETAKILAGIIRHIENVSDADIAYDTGAENQVVRGIGYWRVLTDYCDEESFNQEIFIRRIRNPNTVRLDPDIQDPCGADAKFGFIEEVLTESEFKEQHPNAEVIDWDFVGRDSSMTHWYITGEKKVRIAEYFYIEHEDSDLKGIDAQGKEITRKVRKPRVKWCKLTGQEVLDKKDWAGKYIPIIRCVGREFDVDGELIVSGHVRNAKDPQRMYNYWTSLEAELYALAPKAPFIGAVGQFEGQEDKWGSANTDNHAYLQYNPIDVNGALVGRPERQPPIMPQLGLIQAKMGAADDLKGTTSQYDASLGQKSNETSGVAIQRRQMEGDVATFDYLDNHAKAIRHTGRIVLDLIPKIYDRTRIARILGEDGEPDQVPISPEIQGSWQAVQGPNQQTGELEEIGRIYNPSIGKYDVVVSTGPSYTTKRQEAADMMTQLVSASPELWKVIGDLIVKNYDWPGAEDLAERFKVVLLPEVRAMVEGNKQNPELQQAMAMVQQLQQQMQAMAQSMEAAQVKIDGYNAESKRLDIVLKALGPVLSLEAQQALGMSTVAQAMQSPDVAPLQ